MADQRIYLDHNASSPIRPEAARAVGMALIRGGNPSSVHAEGRRARAVVEAAREAVAALVGASAKNVTFTSGATEALALATNFRLKADADKRPWRLFASATEHPAALNGHRFADGLTLLSVGPDGVTIQNSSNFEGASSSHFRPLAMLQHANNETGVIQPVSSFAETVHAAGGLLICDAAQSAGKVPVDMAALGADLLVLSAHKIGGPAGVGALIRRSDAIHFAEPVMSGGGQEKGLRGGTENLAGVAGFGAAAKAALAALPGETDRLRRLRDQLEAGLRALDPEVRIFGAEAERLPNTTAFALTGLVAETALMALDLDGVALSSGSACSSGKVKRSHVLEAMGVEPDIAKCALRASLGWSTTEPEVETFLEILGRVRAKASAVRKVLAA